MLYNSSEQVNFEKYKLSLPIIAKDGKIQKQFIKNADDEEKSSNNDFIYTNTKKEKPNQVKLYF